MLVNFVIECVYCFWCNRWLDFHLLYLNTLYDGSVTCEGNHLVGNEADKEWIRLCGYEDNIERD